MDPANAIPSEDQWNTAFTQGRNGILSTPIIVMGDPSFRLAALKLRTIQARILATEEGERVEEFLKQETRHLGGVESRFIERMALRGAFITIRNTLAEAGVALPPNQEAYTAFGRELGGRTLG